MLGPISITMPRVLESEILLTWLQDQFWAHLPLIETEIEQAMASEPTRVGIAKAFSRIRIKRV